MKSIEHIKTHDEGLFHAVVDADHQRIGGQATRIWLVSFMKYDLRFFDEETTRLEPIANPFEA